MTLNQLLYFIEIYKEKSISLAAINLNISQQSLSSSLRELELELSVPLFIRSSKGTFPTEKGKLFYQSVQIILEELMNFQKMCLSSENLVCKIGFPIVFPDLASKVYKSLISAYPNVFFELQPFHYNDFNNDKVLSKPDVIFTYLTEKLLNNKAVFGKMDEEYIIKYISFRPKTVGCWVAKESPMAKQNYLDEQDINSSKICLYRDYYDLDSILHYLFSSNEVANPFYIAQTDEVLVDLIKRYRYISLDICDENIPMIFPNLLNDKDLVLRPLSNKYSKLYLVLIYKKKYERYYLHISKILTKEFE